MKNEYTVYDTYTKDDAFTGSLDACIEWLGRMEKLYPMAFKRGRWTAPI